MSANEGTLKITNTLSGRKEPWSPQVAGEAKLYVCGITAYDHCHLGHARSAIVFDVIRNHLEAKGLSVRYVKNFTDVDDKIIHRARQEGKDWREIAETYIGSYERDMARLGVRPPTVAPKATEHIPEMIRIVEGLIAKGVAYPIDGSVYFEVAKFPAYGKLSKQKLDEMMAGARVEVDERKKSPLDFALWKASKPGEPAWESPWGMGRPGWHIECSAMAIRHLGKSFDLHGGGKDLIFPHHENEIAQSEAYTEEEFVRAWIHHGFVTVNQEKMSKSLGNFFTIKEIFEKSGKLLGTENERKISEIVRYFLLSVHYRSPIDFSEDSLKNAKAALDNFYFMFFELRRLVSSATGFAEKQLNIELLLEEAKSEIENALDDDFNIPAALGRLQSLRSEVNKVSRKLSAEQAQNVLNFFTNTIGKVLGLFLCSPDQDWGIHEISKTLEYSWKIEGYPDGIQEKIRKRDLARQEKNWVLADQLRKELEKEGYILEDRPDGTTRIKR